MDRAPDKSALEIMGQASGLGHAQLEQRLVATEVVAHEFAAPAVLTGQSEEVTGVLPGACFGKVEYDRLDLGHACRAVAPQVRPMRLAVARLEHGHRRLVGVQHAVHEHLVSERLYQGQQLHAARTHPGRQR